MTVNWAWLGEVNSILLINYVKAFGSITISSLNLETGNLVGVSDLAVGSSAVREAVSIFMVEELALLKPVYTNSETLATMLQRIIPGIFHRCKAAGEWR